MDDFSAIQHYTPGSAVQSECSTSLAEHKLGKQEVRPRVESMKPRLIMASMDCCKCIVQHVVYEAEVAPASLA